MKGLYRKRNADNTTNAGVLGVFLIVFNLHSVIVLLECFTGVNVGLLEFWKPSDTPKVGMGYIGGFSLAVAYLLGIGFVKKNTSEKERRLILKNIVSQGRRKLTSVFYTLFSVLLFLFTILLLIITIIPDGGIK
ncbi:hypothetical protein [Luteibaculum oceani]|uniref:Uncharacterized protein n=1 Tax=Luteibaculum oceani TaxID=1294296 RepID=A0A5C6V2Z0_9FLAO|nr:hypothetical protein [Luteibaculum oceani]TXC78866.1 hypothetical protein FRX97_06540 [Luteibaculum oceani]